MWFTKCVKYIRFKLRNEFLFFPYNCQCICRPKHFCKKKKKICWAPLWSPIFPHTLSQLPCLLPAMLADKSNQKKKKFKNLSVWCTNESVYLDTVKFILHIDHDLCFKYHWTFNHFFYWLASEYLNIHFSSRVAVWVLSECSVNSDRFVFLPELG